MSTTAPPVASMILAMQPGRPASTTQAARPSSRTLATPGARPSGPRPHGSRRGSPPQAGAPAQGTAGQTAAQAEHQQQQQRQQQQQQQQRRRLQQLSRLLPWALPLGAGVLVVHLARLAAARVRGKGRQASRAPHALGGRSLWPGVLPRRAGSTTPPPGRGGAAARQPSLLWFRSDLRLHDHAPLVAAAEESSSLVPVYVFDPREYGTGCSGFDKTGPFRAAFILTALAELRERLRAAGTDLLVRMGKVEEVLPQLALAVGAVDVHCHAEVTSEEQQVERALAAALDAHGCRLRRHWGGTLHDPADMPFQMEGMPLTCGEFRERLRSVAVRAPLPRPAQLPGLPVGAPQPGPLPRLTDLGFTTAALQRCRADHSARAAGLRGGEGEALRRVARFARELRTARAGGAAAAAAARGRGGSTAAATSLPGFLAKVSPWLALGCLSPRELYSRLRGEAARLHVSGNGGGSGAAPALLFELLWRDFFRLIATKYAAAGDAGDAGGWAAAASSAGAMAAA